MTSQKTVTIFTANTGHISVAQALEAALSSHARVHVINVSVPGFSLYYPFYRYFPQLSHLGYQAGQQKNIYQAFQKFLGDTYRLKIVKTIAQDRPDLIFSTYYPANPTIESVATEARIPFFNVLTDPRTISAFLPSAHALNCVFDQNAYNYCHQILSIPKKNLIITGWFTRPQYQSTANVNLRSNLKIPKNQLTFLVAAGSEGTNLVLKIIPTFLQAKTPLTLFVACGHNHQLFEIIRNLKRAHHLLRPNSKINIIPLAFTNKLFQYLQVSDLVIGKAGPNLLFESVACHVPFFAVTHISGQEDGNLDLIREYHLGFVEENTLKANRLLKQIIAEPQILKTYTPHLKAIAHHNQQAPQILLQAAAKYFSKTFF